MSKCQCQCEPIVEVVTWPSRLARDLMDDLITEDNMPPVGSPELLSWIESLGLDPYSIAARGGMVIDPSTMTLYWREFAIEDGARVLRGAGDEGYKLTRTKSMHLDKLPEWLR